MSFQRRLVLVAFVWCCLASGPAWAGQVKVGIYPSNDPAKLYTVMTMLADYLSERTGDEVSAVVTRDYDELAQRLINHTLDIAWINTLNYVKMKDDIPRMRYIATYMERNETTGTIQPYYQSYIIAMKGGGVRSLEDGRGKNFAFTDLGSTSGYAYPRLLLKRRGIDPATSFAKVFFLKKHDRVVNALLSGAIDLGAVSDGTYFTAVRTHGDRFAILAKSAPIPLDAIVTSERFPEDRARAYQQAFTAMPSDHAFCKAMRDVLGWSAAGFEVRDDSFYDDAREALKQ